MEHLYRAPCRSSEAFFDHKTISSITVGAIAIIEFYIENVRAMKAIGFWLWFGIKRDAIFNYFIYRDGWCFWSFLNCFIWNGQVMIGNFLGRCMIDSFYITISEIIIFWDPRRHNMQVFQLVEEMVYLGGKPNLAARSYDIMTILV